MRKYLPTPECHLTIKQIKRVLPLLSKQQRYVLRHRGYLGGHRSTLKDIAEFYQMSRAHIHQVEAYAIRALNAMYPRYQSKKDE